MTRLKTNKVLYPVRVCSESPRQDKSPPISTTGCYTDYSVHLCCSGLGITACGLRLHAPNGREFHSHDVSPVSQLLPHLHVGAFSSYVWILLASLYVAFSVLLGYNILYLLAFSSLSGWMTCSLAVNPFRVEWKWMQLSSTL